MAIAFTDQFQLYNHGPNHPLQPRRLQLTWEQISSRGLLREVEVVEPPMAQPAELALAHAPAYVELVQRLSDPLWEPPVPWRGALQAGFGSGDNPIFEYMHDGAAIIAGASLRLAMEIHAGRFSHAFNPAGGLHHAMRDRASGFCIYNDAAVAAAWLAKHGHRVAYVDLDVHHGDGVEAIFASDPNVLTISLHESGRYLFPGTGFTGDIGIGPGRGTAANLPYQPYTWDEPWLMGFRATVPPLLRRFQPTFLISQHGCDTHLLDPLAHLQCSTRIWPEVTDTLHRLAHELCAGRWLAVGGGGYAVEEVVPRAWTIVFAHMLERPQTVADMVDREQTPPVEEAQERVWSFLEKEIRELGRAHQLPLRLDRDPTGG